MTVQDGPIQSHAAPQSKSFDPETRIFRPLLLLIGLAPLPLASNRPWSWSLLALVTGLLLITWSWDSLRAARPIPVSPRRIAWPAALFLLVCLYAALQTLPNMPAGIANPFWTLSLMPGASPRNSISINVAETWTALMRLLSYGVVFWLFLQVGRSKSRALRVIWWIAVITALYSAYGLVVHLGGFKTILWFDKWAYQDSLTSTFVNRNSFATFAGLGLLCSLGLFVRGLLRGGPLSWTRRGLANLVEMVDLSQSLSLVCLMANIGALFLTQSRAGTVAGLAAAFLFLIGLGFARGRRRRPSIVLCALFGALGVYYLALSGDGLAGRLASLAASGLDDEVRTHAYRDIVRAIPDHALWGTGYGAFDDVFKAYRSTAVPAYFDKAHNTYLENALELGVPAAAALVVAIGLLAVRCLYALGRRSSAFVFGWIAFCGSVLVGLHALLDFSLQIPAVAVTYAALLGTGCAQSWSRQTRTADPR